MATTRCTRWWPGLRRALHDSATQPIYLETIRKQGYRLLAPVRVLSEQGPRSHAEGWRGQSPFCGLEAFDEAHASVFFGRDAAVAALRERLGQQWRRGHPLVVLLGPSGSGKTSLVQAGLLPALAELPEAAGPESADDAAPLRVCTTATVDLGAVGRRAGVASLDAWAGLAGALLDWDCQGVPLLSGFSIDSLSTALCERPQDVLRQLAIGLDATRGLHGGARHATAAGAGPPGGPAAGRRGERRRLVRDAGVPGAQRPGAGAGGLPQ